jgi:CRP-like cAMP-binding protein
MTDDRALHVLSHAFPRLDVAALTSLLTAGRLQQVPAGEVLCRQGALEQTFYVVIDGSVDIFVSRDGQRFFVDNLKQGACFGEIALVLARPRSADVVAAETTTVLALERDAYESFIVTNVALVSEIVTLLAERVLSQQDRLLAELASYRRKAQTKQRYFVSYARGDTDFVLKMTTDLEKHGIELWMDIYNLDPGESWSKQVNKGLDGCAAMLLVMTPDSLASGEVESEWNYYLSKGKPIIPILAKACELPYRLYKLQYISFVDTLYETALAKLVAHLQTPG